MGAYERPRRMTRGYRPGAGERVLPVRRVGAGSCRWGGDGGARAMFVAGFCCDMRRHDNTINVTSIDVES